MARRRSARLASVPKATPTAASTANLGSVAEREESPINETTQSLNAVMSSPVQAPQTPSTASLMKPPMSEMHPSKVHPTMAPPSSALRLGFTNIKPKASTNPGVGTQQSTPSKSNIPSSPFTFQFARGSAPDSALGPEAQRMMNEIREEAAKIKAELAAKREEERLEEQQVNARKIAKPKGKAGRYSEVHMADFRKMDSIENHPSAFRATPGRFTPVTNTKGVKRSQSKANIHEDETPRIKTPVRIPASKFSKKMHTPAKELDSPAKRTKQHRGDDASTNRPISRDGSGIPLPKTPGKDAHGIPRSKSTLAKLMSPTQASHARAAATKTPTAGRSLLKSPSKVTLTGLKKSATASNPDSIDADKEEISANLRSPSRFDKVKSIFAKYKTTASVSKSGIPKPAAVLSNTPAPARAQKELPPAPLTTPGKNTSKRGDFTPAPKHAALAQNSPSPVKSAIPRSKTTNNLANYPSLDMVVESAAGDPVSYPDLSGYRPLPAPPVKIEFAGETSDESSEDQGPLPISVPGTFTFRSDHTIRFGSSSPKGFGANSGQSSVRHVRPSIMPGAFPSTNMPAMATPRGKENIAPYLQQPFDVKMLPHGVANKKRNRVEDDEEEADREATERAAKKMRNAMVPEGEALVAPRLFSARKSSIMRSPSKLMKSPSKSPTKSRIPAATTTPGGSKKAGISLSRLSYLAQPKQRK